MNAQVNPPVEAEEVNHFAKLANVNVSQHVEKKQNMSYLSWSWAVDQLMRHDPKANWSFREPMVYPDGTMMVHCDVTAFGKSMYMFLPVMDHRNKAIQNPDAFAINKAMMRCLVKGIAVHGLGLYIYAGEDLPEEEKQAQIQQYQQQQAQYRQQQMQQQAPKPKLDDERFKSALAQIEAGKYSKQALKDGFDLTEEQRKEVEALA
jgi:hypothetical protein